MSGCGQIIVHLARVEMFCSFYFFGSFGDALQQGVKYSRINYETISFFVELPRNYAGDKTTEDMIIIRLLLCVIAVHVPLSFMWH